MVYSGDLKMELIALFVSVYVSGFSCSTVDGGNAVCVSLCLTH